MSEYFSFTPLTKRTLARAESVNDIFNAVDAGFGMLPSLATLTNYFAICTDASVATNAYILTPQKAISAYSVGQQFRFIAIRGNTGPCTVIVSGVGVVNLKQDDGTALVSGDIPAGALVTIVNTGSEFRLAITGGIAETSNVVINDFGIGIGAPAGAAPRSDVPIMIINEVAGGSATILRNPSTSALAYAAMICSNSTAAIAPDVGMYKFGANVVASGLEGPGYGAFLCTYGPVSIGTVHSHPIYFGIANVIVGSIDTAGAMNMPAFIPTSDTAPSNGLYLSAANSPAISANSALIARFTTAAIACATALGLFSRTVAQLGSITPTAGLQYYCSNEAGGAVPVFGDGTNWRRVTDRAVMS